ncbi:non-ribosomal peptide synthetase [Nostoc sp. FACHB-110]|uniref:non-ribosomal peptide synthetase n=1 Tax=Nostoc sp. FACHB-110 TaxID=2692834 RepID=UPI00168599B1|nr:non-ribosomal peptide synthetase [Nostoc sp. FACHB-110]MBD2435874.1 amino acid adenylation domain-containing protein [Nostoc sp. FACHB-110]
MQTQIIEGFRLAPQQKRLWFLQQSNLGYRTQCALLITGNLQVETLKTAIEQIISSHDILRTTFRYLPGMKSPVMVRENQPMLSWRNIYLGELESEEISANIQAILQEHRRLGGNFEQGSILNFSLLKLSTEQHILVVDLPALCADTWTIKNLMDKISRYYTACLQGQQVNEAAVQYIQFAEWQNQLLEEPEAQLGKKYWQKQDFSALSTLKLPLESKLLKAAKFEPESVSFTVDVDVVIKLLILAKNYNTSLNVVLLACWKILIWRLTGQSDIIIGLAINRREYAELEDLLGLVATWLPIQSHLTSDLRFDELLEIVQKSINDGEEWQDYFVAELLENENNFAWPICFEFADFSEKITTENIAISLDKHYSCTEQFKVKLSCILESHNLITNFDFDSNYFSLETIQRLASQLQTLLANVTQHPDATINNLDILSQSDRQQLLIEFNHTAIAPQQYHKCIHHIFAEQVEKTPDRIAVISAQQQLTYTDLNRQANQLAHYLQALGVKPEFIVGLYVERSLEMIVGLLGILKAGGAYLPIDATLPTQNLTARLQDAQVSIVLTQKSLQHHIPKDAGCKVICLDSDWDAIAQSQDTNPSSEVTIENLLYVLFTSGSTGKPKGVAVEHQQLVNYLNSIIPQLNLPPAAHFANVSTLAADLGNTVIFASLCTGGCLHLLSFECATNASALAEYFCQYPIDCLKIVPSHLASLLASAPAQSILPRQLLILGGEAATWDLIAQIQQQAANCRILNHYGPTEATVGTLTYLVEPNHQLSLDSQTNTVPLGRPLAHSQVYLLDEQMRPVPIGVTGELYIAGAGLARGYLHRPQLTAEKFLANPLNHNCTRLYKTGDLARYLPNGNIEFIGRVDRQIKLRGFRIELGEIESIICQSPQVQQAVVVLQQQEKSHQRLVAYIVLKPQNTMNTGDLRQLLTQKLPEYMIPSAFVILKALPLTNNGKIDFQALPEPDSYNRDLATIYQPPQTEFEQAIANIWQEMLNVEKVGINDNFFELGGHSLLLVQIHSKLQKIVNQNLSITDLFAYPTISALAKYLTQDSNQKSSLATSQNRAESRIAARNQRRR